MLGLKTEKALLKLTAVMDGNLCLVGPFGSGKTTLAEAFAEDMQWRTFSLQFFPLLPAEEVFGPYTIDGLKRGTYERNTSGRLYDCEVAVLDEIDKAGPAVLNSLLRTLENRIELPSKRPLPLRMTIGVANRILTAGEDGAVLRPLWDRFHMRAITARLQDDLWPDLLSYSRTPGDCVDASERHTILAAQADYKAGIAIDRDLAIRLDELRIGLREDEGVHISERRFRQSGMIVRAAAALAGRKACLEDDLEWVRYSWWETADDADRVNKWILKQCNPQLAKVEELLDSAMELLRGLESATFTTKVERMQAYAAANDQLADISAQLRSLKGSAASDGAAVVATHQESLARRLSALLRQR